jgi:hypothetical protein
VVRLPTPALKRRCYITSATCHALGLGDDCEVLCKLRWFRDNVMAATSAGLRDIETYYATAPAIVEAIDARPDALRLYREIYFRHLAVAVRAIDRGDNHEAYQRYRDLVLGLSERYLSGSPTR